MTDEQREIFWRVCHHVLMERDRQMRKHGHDTILHDPFQVQMCVLVEEVGEAAKEMNDNGKLGNLRNELIQVAAVAIAMVESIDIYNPDLPYTPPGYCGPPL